MSPEDLTRRDTREKQIESIRNMRRREQALFRAPVTAPAGFSKQELRRQCLETKEEFEQRG